MSDTPESEPRSWVPLAFPCPHCGEPGIGLLRKLSLGPALPATCSHCARRVGVPWRTVLFPVLPFCVLWTLLLIGLSRVDIPELPGLLVRTRTATCLTLLGLSSSLYSLYWIHRVPLIRR